MTDPVAHAAACADRLEAVERAGLNAVRAYDREALLDRARAQAARGGPLAGVVIGVKDNICTAAFPTTCGSRLLEQYRSPFAATAVTRLTEAGAVLACTTNLDEFAMGSSTEHSAFGRTRHPTHPERVPGGSSGGSAALVATGAVDAALGSETGGSVRQPAAFCGVVGLKPTYGRVSRWGLVAYGSSLDQIGVLAPRVAVAERALVAMAGPDPRDATAVPRPAPVPLPPRDTLAGLTVGLPREYFPPELDPAIRAACEAVIVRLRAAGAAVRPVSLPHTALAIPCYYVLAPAEASSNLARFDGVRYGGSADAGDVRSLYRATRGAGFGAEVRRRILVGTFVLSAGAYEAYYAKAVRARRLITRDFRTVFGDGVDVLFTPTTPTTAFRAGERLADPVAMYAADAFVCPANLAGVPAVSLPIGRAGGLPVGGQLMAPPFAEPALLQTAAAVERLVGAGWDG